jgi:hypothetical protein
MKSPRGARAHSIRNLALRGFEAIGVDICPERKRQRHFFDEHAPERAMD